METFYYYDSKGNFTYSLPNPNEGATLPDNAIATPTEIKKGFWPVLNDKKTGWVQKEDHRKVLDSLGREVPGTGTP